jgi:two-component system cell cycle response regulator DivK
VTGPTLEKRRILLVEDNETIRHAFTMLLEESGYRVSEATTGAEALTAAESDPPDLMILDLGLPDMHGLEVTRRIRGNSVTNKVRVLALTGRTLEADAAECRAAGCDGYLAKPVDSEMLLRRIAELTRG